jgi:hypothetical protein
LQPDEGRRIELRPAEALGENIGKRPEHDEHDDAGEIDGTPDELAARSIKSRGRDIFCSSRA